MKRLHDNPLLPADAGLSALGLMMRLGGGAGLWLGMFMVLFSVNTRASSMTSLAFAVGIARSWAHARAGRRLQQSAPEAVGALALYFGLAVVNIVALLVTDTHRALIPITQMILLATSAWPVIVLALVLRPSARRVLRTVRRSRARIFAEDGGVMGAAGLMSVAGVVGSVVVALWCVMAVPLVSRAGILGVMLLLLGLAFLARSALQATAGIRALRSFNPNRFYSDTARYFSASVITTVLLCPLTLITGLQTGIIGFVVVVPVGALSMLWPSILRAVGTVELRPDLDDDPPTVSASRDNGVVTLGIAMCAMAGMGAASISMPLQAGLPAGAAAPLWLTVGFLTATLWAAAECVAMSSRRKIAVAVYLVAAVASAGHGLIQSITLLDSMPIRSPMNGAGVWLSVLASVVVLAMPTIVGVQVLRKGAPRPPDLESVF